MRNSNKKDGTSRQINFLLYKMSKKIVILLSILIFSFYAKAQNNFVPGITDLPVPANFHLEEDSSSVYNNGFDRLVTASFIGKAQEDAIIDFYYKTLPALGWAKQARLLFTRDDEILMIRISRKNKEELVISFKLTPAR